MRRALSLCALILCLSATAVAQNREPSPKIQPPGTTPQASPSLAAAQAARASFAKLPLAFEENAGQTDERVRYTSRGLGYSLFLTEDEAVFVLRGGADPSHRDSEASPLWMKMIGASPSVKIAPADPLPGKINYYIGNNPSKWRTGVLQYGRITYQGIYPGVDLMYYGNQQQLESDFIVEPGASPQSIEYEVTGAREMHLDAQGNLVLTTGTGNVQLLRPVVYQMANNTQREISGRYVLRGKNRVGFKIGSYDKHNPLIIDPVLLYSTFLGGSTLSVGGDSGNAIAIDSTGNAYVTGNGQSADFPTTTLAGPVSPSLTIGFAFVTKFDPNGNTFLYSTVLRGTTNFGSGTSGNGIGVDAAGNAYLDGITSDADFPLLNPFQATIGDDPVQLLPGGIQSGFVSGLDTTGALIYSTFFGGRNANDRNFLTGLAADAAGDAYVVGYTNSQNFPTVNPYQATSKASLGNDNVVVGKFNPQGQPIYSTYLGGSGPDIGTAIAIDSSGNAYVTGKTSSVVSLGTGVNFPVQSSPPPFQATFNGSSPFSTSNLFVSKLSFTSPTLTLANSTYLGGSNTDEGFGIAVDTATPPNVYLTGQTTSVQNVTGTIPFPTLNSIYNLPANNATPFTNAFVTKLKGDFSALVYSTLLGATPTSTATGNAIGLDGANPPNAFVTGSAGGANFPVLNPLQSMLMPLATENAFITEVTQTLNGSTAVPALGYSTYLGGRVGDVGKGIAVDSSGNAYIAGITTSANFPVLATTGQPYQSQLAASLGNAFVAKVSPLPAAATLNFFPPAFSFGDETIGFSSPTEAITLTNNSSANATVNGLSITGLNSGDFSIITSASTCAPNLVLTTTGATASCIVTVQFSPQQQDARSATLTVTYNTSSTVSMNLSGFGGAPEVSLNPSTLSFGTNVPLNVPTIATLIVNNRGGGILRVGGVQIENANFPVFSISNSCAVVAPFSSCFITVTLLATADKQAYTANLVLNDNAAGSPQTVPISGTGAAQVTVTPTSFEFGGWLLGTSSLNSTNAFVRTAVDDIVVTNGSAANITLTSIQEAGNTTDFLTDPTPPSTGRQNCAINLVLPPGASCAYSVYFQPTVASGVDGRTATYTFTWSGGPNSPQTVTVKGAGESGVTLYTNNYTAPNEFVGAIEHGPDFDQIFNGTNSPVMVTSIVLSGANPQDFHIELENACSTNFVIPANSVCFLDGSFSPSAVGPRSVTATINYTIQSASPTNGFLTLNVTGNGLPGPVNFPTAFDFGSQIVGVISPTHVFYLDNLGKGALTISGITLPTDAEFAQINASSEGACKSGGVVPGGGNCFFEFAFTPSATGSHSTTLTVTDNGPNSPRHITLTGTGVAGSEYIIVAPNALDFGSVPLNQTVGASFYLTNANTGAGAQSTTINTAGAPVLTTTTGTPFTLVAPPPAPAVNLTCTPQSASPPAAPITVPPQGGNCSVGITFKPTATGLQQNSVTLTDSLGGKHTVPIQGTGVTQGAVSVSPSSLVFTTTQAGAPPAAQPVTLTNTGTGPVTVTVVALAGPNGSSFAINGAGTTCVPGTTGFTVAAGASCTISISFNPPASATAGTYTAGLVINASLGNNALYPPGAVASPAVTITATVVGGGLSASPNPISFGTVAVGTTLDFTSLSNTFSQIALTSNINATLTITSIVLQTASDFTISPFNTCTTLLLNSSCFFDMTFAPKTPALESNNVFVSYTVAGIAGTQTFIVPVNGTGTSVLSASPNPANIFTSVGVTNGATISFGNGSTSTLTITSFGAITGTTPTPFTMNSDFCTNVPMSAGGVCTINVSLAATAPTPSGTPAIGQFAVNYNINGATQTPLTESLSGTIAAPQVTITYLNQATNPPNTVIFPAEGITTQGINTRSLLLEVVVTNSGNAPLLLSPPFKITGTNASDFSFAEGNIYGTVGIGTQGCEFVFQLLHGQSCSIPIAFTPGPPPLPGGSTRMATLTITDNAYPSGTQTVLLEGNTTGVSVSSISLNFPDTLLGSSVTRSVVVTNQSSSAVTFSGVTFGTTSYSIDTSQTLNACAASIPAAPASCTIYIKFTPQAVGANLDVATIHTSVGSPTVALSGNGKSSTVTVSPTALTFGGQAVNTQSSAQAATLTNGTASSITISGTPAVTGDFLLGTNTCTSGATITSGSTCTVNVIFKPTATGTRNGTLVISETGTPNSVTVQLSGTGTAPSAQVAASLAFGPQPTNQTATMPLTLTNNGTATLNLAATNAVAITVGTNSTLFGIGGGTTCTNGLAIAVNGTCTINVTFAPTAVGSFGPVTLVITDDSGGVAGTKQSVSLTGSGVAAALNFAPSPVNFTPGQRVGTTSVNVTVTLTNSGGLAVHLAASNAVTIGGTNASDFPIVAAGTTCINSATVGASGGSCTVILTFTPSAAGARTATLTVTDDANPTTQSVALNGTGVFPQATPSPSPVAFGNQRENVASAAQTLTLTNGGTDTLHITTVALGGTNVSDFAIATGTTCTNGSTVAAGGNCVVKLTFTPKTLTAESATITFTDDASPTTQVVNLTGTGVFPQATPSPSPVAFGNQRENVASAAQTLTLTNGGTDTLHITTVALGGTNQADFAIATGTTCTNGSTVAAGGNCVVKLTFTPKTVTAESATITFTDDASPTTQVVNLTGTGVFPQASPAPGTLAFGNQSNGITSAPQTITLTNGGTDTLHITTVVLGGTNASVFTIASGTTCTNGSTVAAGSSCIVNVTFKPTGLSSFAATVTFTDDASPASQVVNLTGTGVASTVIFNPSAIGFGNQRQGVTSGQMTTVLSNTGSTTLTINSSITVTGTNVSDFALATPATGTDCRTLSSLNAGSSCVIAVTFTPGGLGTRSATVSVADSATGSPHTLPLTGTGVFPQATPSPSPVAFGNQRENVASAAQTLTLTNGGTDTLHITTVALGGTNVSDFAIATGTTCTNGSTVAAGGNCVVKLTFTPKTLTAESATITFTDDASPTTQVVNLTGTGVFPQATPSPSPVAFGNQRENVASAAQTLTLTNGGTDTLHITTVALGGTNQADFAIATGTTCTNGSTVAAGGNCVVKLTFTPKTLTAESATITFTDDASPTTQVVNLTGTGVFPQASPAPGTLAFGNQSNGITSAPQTITLTNGGTDTLHITTVVLGGTNASVFTIASGTTCTNGSTVAAGSSCIVNVTFKPSGLSSFTATMTFTDDASPATQVVNLTGTGVASTVIFNPSAIGFGNERQGVTSGQMTTVLSNTGSTTLTITGITVTGTNASDFAPTTPASGTDCQTVGSVAASGTCTIAVTFTPSATGSRSATVSVSDSATGSPHTFGLTGTGIAPAVSLSPNPVTFANQIETTTSAPQALTLTNTGTDVLHITTVVLGGTNAADFAIASTGTTCIAGSTVAVGSTCVVNLTFTPPTANPFSATVTFTDDAIPTTQVVNLSGTGVTPPTATPSPTSLTFTSQATGTTSAAQTVTLSNTGGAPLIITSITLTGSNPGDFAFATPATTCPTGASGGQVPAGSSCVLSVTFDPTAIGSRTASITIVVTGIANPAPITLTGTGIAPDLAISKTHSGSFEVGVPGAYTIKVTNNGTSPTTQQITVTDTLPAGLTFVSGVGTGWTCNAGAQNGQIVTCTNAGPINLSAANASTITLTVTPALAAFNNSPVTNTATVADAGDSGAGTSDKTATDPTIITAPDLVISKTHTGDFTVGATGMYTITVTNKGTGPTIGAITVTDTLPAGLSFTSNTGAGWACAAGAQNPQVVTCSYSGGALAAAGGTSTTLMLTVSVGPNAISSSNAAGFTVTNMVTVSDPNDSKTTDKSASDATNIDNATPTLSSFTPALGLIAGATSDQQITLTGTGFNASSVVNFGSIALPGGTANSSGTSLTISVPHADLATAPATGNVSLTVTNTKTFGGTPLTSQNQSFPVVALAGITPNTGTPNPVPVVAGTPYMLQMNLALNPSAATLPADITITCSLPSSETGATCMPNPATIPHASTSLSSTITITAVPTSGTTSSTKPSGPGPGPSSRYLLWLVTVVLMSMLALAGTARQRMQQFRRAPVYLALVLLVLAAGALVGCTTSPSGPTPTPTGPSTITVTATAADGATVSATVPITVSN